MYVYIVWEQATCLDEEVLLDVFENEADANKFSDKIENEQFTYCKVTSHKLR